MGGGLRSSYEAIWFKTWFQLMCVNFQFAFTQWIALLPKNCFLVFFKATLFCRWKKFQLCQSSYSCFFAKYILYFERLMYVDWSFSRLKICIWLPVQPKKLVFGWEMSKIQPFTYCIFHSLTGMTTAQCNELDAKSITTLPLRWTRNDALSLTNFFWFYHLSG